MRNNPVGLHKVFGAQILFAQIRIGTGRFIPRNTVNTPRRKMSAPKSHGNPTLAPQPQQEHDQRTDTTTARRCSRQANRGFSKCVPFAVISLKRPLHRIMLPGIIAINRARQQLPQLILVNALFLSTILTGFKRRAIIAASTSGKRKSYCHHRTKSQSRQ